MASGDPAASKGKSAGGASFGKRRDGREERCAAPVGWNQIHRLRFAAAISPENNNTTPHHFDHQQKQQRQISDTMSFTNPDDLDQAFTTSVHEFITAVWTKTLPAEVEQDLRSRATSTGTFYDDLLCLHNQYHTALAVLAQHGITRAVNAPEMSDQEKRKLIMIARSMLTETEPTPEAC
eukprot:COSAG01_NODE_383_length_17798_cov_351.422058_21_plen_179_part_01